MLRSIAELIKEVSFFEIHVCKCIYTGVGAVQYKIYETI